MKVVQDNYTIQTTESDEYICEKCNSVFIYDNYDVYTDKDNIERVDCPCCGHSCIVYTPITIDNIRFPINFNQIDEHNGAIKINNEKITDWIKECINYLKNNPEEFYRYTASGNTFVCVFNHDDEYYVMVAKNYFDCDIDK